jgi:hypothetical protein
MQGNWVRTSVKVNLTPEEKIKIGRRSAPRWEIDVVAYSGRENLLSIVECKSYIDSYGVRATSFGRSGHPQEARYKLLLEKSGKWTAHGWWSTSGVRDGNCGTRIGLGRS